MQRVDQLSRELAAVNSKLATQEARITELSATVAELSAASTTTCASSPTDGFAVLTNMQWFYGPTWGSTIKLCGRGAPRQRQGNDCARWPDLHRRQLELIEVLRRNVVHPSVADVHVVVGEAPPVEALLRRLPWWPTHGCKVRLIATGRRPTFRDYMVQLTTPPLRRSSPPPY